MDMPHAFPAYRGVSHYNAALITDDTPISDLLILATIALEVLGGTKYPLAEKPVPFWFQGAIVDRLRFSHLTVRPTLYLLWRGETKTDATEIIVGARFIEP
ncbi:MAG: hypothetical protein DDT25_00151 [Chloroflexi bacterium]|nr:hypothetical protein [Chloroflexota bacterium]